MVRSLKITEDGFVFDNATGDSYTLNSCGRVVLQKVMEGQTRHQIVHWFCDQYGLSQSAIDRDITDFLQQLQGLGLTGVHS